MLRVAEQYVGTDTGLQRRANEDSLLARSPLFVVADGMGGAQAGEVASRLAVESFRHGLHDTTDAEGSLAAYARAANVSIHERSQVSAEHAGMGTTLTAVYVGAEELAIAHVGDSRAYCLRGGELLRLTDDHSLVDELIRQGKLTPEEAIEHPQRSVITRALGPEPEVEIDTRSYRARDGDVYLLCSDGLTSMVQESEIERIIAKSCTLDAAGRELIAAANKAGGRDNITVILFRLEEVDGGAARQPTATRRRSRAAAGPPTEPLVVPAPAATGVRDEMPGGPVAPQTLRDGYYTRPPRSPRRSPSRCPTATSSTTTGTRPAVTVIRRSSRHSGSPATPRSARSASIWAAPR